jgi:hypothetical protein
MKNELLTFRKDQNRIQNTKIHASNDGNMVVEIGGYNVTDSTNTKQQRSFMSLLKEGQQVHLHQRYGTSNTPLATD